MQICYIFWLETSTAAAIARSFSSFCGYFSPFGFCQNFRQKIQWMSCWTYKIKCSVYQYSLVKLLLVRIMYSPSPCLKRDDGALVPGVFFTSRSFEGPCRNAFPFSWSPQFLIPTLLAIWHLAQNEVNLTQHNQATANDRMERRLIELSSRESSWRGRAGL